MESKIMESKIMEPKELREFLSECPHHLDALAECIPFSRAYIKAFATEAVPMNRDAKEHVRLGMSRVRRAKNGCKGCQSLTEVNLGE